MTLMRLITIKYFNRLTALMNTILNISDQTENSFSVTGGVGGTPKLLEEIPLKMSVQSPAFVCVCYFSV